MLAFSWAFAVEGSTGRVKPATVGVSSQDTENILRDHGGYRVVPRRYTVVVSTSPVLDSLLLRVLEPGVLVGVSSFTKGLAGRGHRFSGRAVRGVRDRETILSLAPQLVVTHHVGDPGDLARLRAGGVRVFDFGPMGGLDRLVRQARTLGKLVGRPRRMGAVLRTIRRRVGLLKSATAARSFGDGLYVSVVGQRFSGGTVGTSYHDVLRLAGLEDVAAPFHRGWVQYGVEDLIRLDPAWIVTPEGQGDNVCAHGGLREVRACRLQGHVVEIDPLWLHDAGVGMLEAAAALHQALHDRAATVQKQGAGDDGNR